MILLDVAEIWYTLGLYVGGFMRSQRRSACGLQTVLNVT